MHTQTLTLLFEDWGFELRSLSLHSVSLTFLTVLMKHLTGSGVRKKGFTLSYTVPEDISVVKGPSWVQEQELVNCIGGKQRTEQECRRAIHLKAWSQRPTFSRPKSSATAPLARIQTHDPGAAPSIL